MGDLKVVSLSDIRENEVALRTVNRESEDYLGLVESIRSKGFIGAISVREKTDDEGVVYYELIDGLHRFNASKDAGRENINVDVVDLDEDQVLEAQIMANIHKVETKPIEYTRQLKRILTRNPLMTESELAAKLGKSTTWIGGRLSLNKLASEQARTLVDEGKIGLSNAYALAKLPAEEQADWLDRAMTLSPDEFIPQTTDRLKKIREARRAGKDATPAQFSAVPHVQKTKALKEEYESGAMAATLCSKHGVATPVEGFAMGIAWALHMDPDSVEVQKAKDEERRAQRAEKKKAADAARAAKKAAKLQKELAEATSAAAEAEAALQS
jgi:ParB family chromosome partitioning protein